MYRRRRNFKPKKRHFKSKIRRRRRKIIGRGVARPYVDKRKRLMLGSGSNKTVGKQKGGFFPLGAIATGLSAAPPIIDLLTKIIK